MSNFFRADEIFTLAADLECNGEDFYDAAVSAAQLKRVASLFRDCRNNQGRHERQFRALGERLAFEMARPVIHDPFGESDLFLKAMANLHVFGPDADDIPATIEKCQSDRDLINVGIAYEKDLLAFYHWIYQNIRPDWGQDKVAQIVRQHREHLVRLYNNLIA